MSVNENEYYFLTKKTVTVTSYFYENVVNSASFLFLEFGEFYSRYEYCKRYQYCSWNQSRDSVSKLHERS